MSKLFGDAGRKYIPPISKPVRLIELFAGYGSQSMALRNIGADFESYRAVEIDRYAVDSYNAVHNADIIPMDICKVHGKDLGIVGMDNYEYIMFYSYPCFTENALVLTSDGYKRIVDVNVGDMVIGHDRLYHKVVALKNNGVKSCINVKGMGIFGIETTINHKFYVREKFYTYSTKNGKQFRNRNFGVPIWKSVQDMKRNDYIGVPINQNSIIPKWEGITIEWRNHNRSEHKNQISQYLSAPMFWELVGMWVGDGWTRCQGGIVFGVNQVKLNRLIDICNYLNVNYSISKERTIYKFHIPLKEYEHFMCQFGKGAKYKHIPSFMFDMPENLLRSFFGWIHQHRWSY